jgi:hypothetical protein
MSLPRPRISRRQLITAGAIGLAGAAFGGTYIMQKGWQGLKRRRVSSHLGVLQGGVYHVVRPDGQKLMDVIRFDLDHPQFEHHKISVPTHTIEPHPLDSRLGVAAMKDGQVISLFDWKSGRELSLDRLQGGTFFHGHTAFTTDGRYLIASGWRKPDVALAHIYETDDFRLVDRVEIPRGATHDLIHHQGDEFILVHRRVREAEAVQKALADGELDPSWSSLSVWNWRTREVRFVGYDRLREQNYTHLHKSRDGRVHLLTNERSELGVNGFGKGSVEVYDPTKNEVSNVIPVGYLGVETELQSHATTLDADVLWVTIPDRGEVLLWDLRKLELITRIREPFLKPTSVQLSKNGELMIVGDSGRFYAFDPAKGRRLENVDANWPKFSTEGVFCRHTRMALI